MTLPEALQEIAKDYRSHREAAEVFGIDRAYWNRMLWGKKTNPSPEMLARMGLKEVRTYVRVPPTIPSR